jgi:hypothetical protein
MAQNTAQFEAMQYSQAAPVDFGKIAMGFAQVSENKRLEAEKKQKEKDDFQVKMDELYGETIYSPFDSTGLANIDITNQKIKDSIVAQSNIINKMFEEGKLSRPEVSRRMNLLKAQTSQYSNFINGISGAVEEYKKLGDNASASSRYIMDKANELFQNTAPGVDSESMLKFYTKDGETLQSTPFMELQSMLDIRASVNEKEIVNEIIGFEKNANKIFESGTVYNKFLETGKLQSEHKTLISSWTKTQDDKDLFDLADKAGVEVKLEPGKLLSIQNRKEVEDKVNEYLGSLTESSLNIRDYKDEVEGIKVNSMMANDVRQIQALRLKERELEGEPSFDVYTNPSLQDKEGFQIVPRQGKQPSIVGLTQDSLKKLGAEAGLLGAIPEATISYYEEYDKNSYVTITYPIEEKNKVQDKGGNLIDSGTTTKKYITQRLRIPDIETKNFVRTRLKIPTTQSLQVNSNTPQAQGNQENNQVTQDQVVENKKQTIPGF